MASLTITINIDESVVEGYQLNKLATAHGEDDAVIIGRISRANQDRLSHRAEPVAVVLQALCEAVRAAEI